MIEPTEGISIGMELVSVAQRASNKATIDGRSESQINHRGDVFATLPGGKLGSSHERLFSHLRLGQGKGLENVRTGFSDPNASLFSDKSGGSAALAQLWYQLDAPLGDQKASGAEPLHYLEFNFGKMDPFLFFDQNTVADNEAAGFINSAFVHNPLLDAGGNMAGDRHGFTPGVRLAYRNRHSAQKPWSLSVGAFSAGHGAGSNNTMSSPMLIVQAETARCFSDGLGGNYRLYAWTHGRASEFGDGLAQERHSGWGLSVDQRLGQHATLFARAGISTRGTVKFNRALTLGAEWTGGRWSRDADAVGIALGWLKSSAKYAAASGQGKTENLAEVFYRWQLNDSVSLTPDLQWLYNPEGNGDAKHGYLVGLRAAVVF